MKIDLRKFMGITMTCRDNTLQKLIKKQLSEENECLVSRNHYQILS